MKPGPPPPAPSVLGAIGCTPLVLVETLRRGASARVYVKLEQANPTGSHEDRMAKAVIELAEARGALRPRGPVVEIARGGAGAALALVCAAKGHPLKLVVGGALASGSREAIRAFGAELVAAQGEGFSGARELARRIHDEEGAFWPDYRNSHDAAEGYADIGREIFRQLDGAPEAFVGAGGMLEGVSRMLRRHGTRTVAVASSERATGANGEELPRLLDGAFYDEALVVQEADAREIARRLASDRGLFAGRTTGLYVAGAIQVAERLGAGARVVTAAVDSGLDDLAGSNQERSKERWNR